MPEKPSFQDKQYAFARHIRNPEAHPPPEGVEDRRMAIYRELFFNNLFGLLSQTFPVLRRIYGKSRWRGIVRQFMAHHEAQTPYFLKVPGEFVQFLQSGYQQQEDDFPFLQELAHYEWADLALSVSEENNDDFAGDPNGNLLDGIPVVSALAWSFTYRFPVHRISGVFLPESPPDVLTFLALCRRASDEVTFLELNAVTARLLELITANTGVPGRSLLHGLAAEIDYPQPEQLIVHGETAMQQMREAEILLGVK